MDNKVKLTEYLKGSRIQCMLSPLFKMFEALLELFVPLVVASLIDTGIANSDKQYISKMGILLVILGIAGLIFSISAQYFAASASVNFVKRLRHALFERIGRYSFDELDSIGTSTLISRLTSDTDTVQNGLNLVLRLFLRSPFIVFGSMIMAFTVDRKAALTFTVVIPALSAAVYGIMLACIPLNKKVRAALDSLLCSVRETLTGVRVIRAFGKEDLQNDEFQKHNDRLTEIQEYTGRISALLNPLTCIIINIGIAVLIYIGAIRVNSGYITRGETVALYNYMSQILVELVKLANLIITVTKSAACASRIKEALSVKGEAIKPYGEFSQNAPVIEFDNVSFSYNGSGENTLESISFKAYEGETIGIIGSTGSGKTTLINLIPAFYTASSGKVKFKGCDVSKISCEDLRQHISIVPQKAVLFSGTVRSNMLWGNENASDEEIVYALKTAQAKDFVFDRNGLDTVTEQGGTGFSGGQRQRLTVARALLKKADILIFDDSSSALDYATDAEMRKAISENYKKPVKIIVSQRTSSIMNADRIIVLDDGKATVGTHDGLLKSCPVYREIHLSQFDGEAEQ